MRCNGTGGSTVQRTRARTWLRPRGTPAPLPLARRGAAARAPRASAGRPRCDCAHAARRSAGQTRTARAAGYQSPCRTWSAWRRRSSRSPVGIPMDSDPPIWGDWVWPPDDVAAAARGGCADKGEAAGIAAPRADHHASRGDACAVRVHATTLPVFSRSRGARTGRPRGAIRRPGALGRRHQAGRQHRRDRHTAARLRHQEPRHGKLVHVQLAAAADVAQVPEARHSTTQGTPSPRSAATAGCIGTAGGCLHAPDLAEHVLGQPGREQRGRHLLPCGPRVQDVADNAGVVSSQGASGRRRREGTAHTGEKAPLLRVQR